MINQITKNKIALLHEQYKTLSADKTDVLKEIALAEIPEAVYHSNAIENSTLSLADTEKILLQNTVPKNLNAREVFEAKNLAKVTGRLLQNQDKKLSVEYMIELHNILLAHIDDRIAGRFRSGKEWVRIGNHLGANPQFVHSLITELVDNYNKNEDLYFLDNIARFHAEFETIHPFNDGNGRMGRILVNLQLLMLDYPPIIVRCKSKHTDYYPLFNAYPVTMKYDGFTSLFALLLMESLHKRIAFLAGNKIIPLSLWAKQNAVKGNVAVNKAQRQTIPAFRLREKWMIPETYRENGQESTTFHGNIKGGGNG